MSHASGSDYPEQMKANTVMGAMRAESQKIEIKQEPVAGDRFDASKDDIKLRLSTRQTRVNWKDAIE